MSAPNTLTVLGVGLGVPAVVLVPLDLFDVCALLPLHVPTHKVFERTRVFERILGTWEFVVCTNRKKLECCGVGRLGQIVSITVFPRNIRVT